MQGNTVRPGAASAGGKHAREAGEFREWLAAIRLPTPGAMVRRLDELGYVGQKEARRAVCLMAWRHVARVRRIFLEGCPRNTLPPKDNLLLIGPTGCGKSFLVELVFNTLLDIPAVSVDVSTLTESGYVGLDPASVLTRLILSTREHPWRAHVGVVCLDEFDKQASAGGAALPGGGGRDARGTGVQREFLKMLEAAVLPVPVSLDHRAPQAQFRTADVAFVAAGAFTGFSRAAASPYAGGALGFHARGGAGEAAHAAPVSRLSAQSLDAFVRCGFMPELIARFSRIVPMTPLDRGALKAILRKSTVARYRNELRMENVGLRIAGDVYDHIVDKCAANGSGARGLRNELVSVLEEACFEAFSMPAGEPRSVRLYVHNGAVRSQVCAPDRERAGRFADRDQAAGQA